jgi:hypothetical protein
LMMANQAFLSGYARALACTGHDPRVRLRRAAGLGITERCTYGIVTDLAEAGYVVKRVRRVWPERGWWQ